MQSTSRTHRLFCLTVIAGLASLPDAQAAQLSLRFAGGGNEATLAYGETAVVQVIWTMAATDTAKSGAKVTGLATRFHVNDPLGEPVSGLFVEEVTGLPGWDVVNTNGVPFTEVDFYLGTHDPTGAGIAGNGTVFESVLASFVVRNNRIGDASDALVTIRHSSPNDPLPAADLEAGLWSFMWQDEVVAAKQFDLGLGNPGDADAVWDPYHGYETFQPLTLHLAAGVITEPHPGECTTLPGASGDFDAGGDVDLADFAGLQACYTGPSGAAGTGCEVFFADGDTDVDVLDYDSFRLSMTGPGEPATVYAPAPGAPRPWEAGMSTGTNTLVNLRTGNMLTTIPIVSWSV